MTHRYGFHTSALTKVLMPALQALPPERRRFRTAKTIYPYDEPRYLAAIKVMRDATGGSPAQRHANDVLFRMCNCTTEDGLERKVCVPPEDGYMCKRTTDLLKWKFATEASAWLIEQTKEERERLEVMSEAARDKANEVVTMDEWNDTAKAAAEKRAMEDVKKKHREDWIQARYKELEAEQRKNDKDRAKKIKKLTKARDKAVNALKKKIAKLECVGRRWDVCGKMCVLLKNVILELSAVEMTFPDAASPGSTSRGTRSATCTTRRRRRRQRSARASSGRTISRR